MSIDFQFITLVDDLEVIEVTELDGSVPRTISVFGGPGFAGAQRVEINDLGVDSFQVASDRLLLVQPPDTPFGDIPASQMSVAVLSGELTQTRKSRLTFTPTLRTRQVSGIQKLVQQVVKELLSDIGSDRFDPSAGGDLVRAIGETLSPSGQSQVATILSQGASRVQDSFLAAQANDSRLTADERLLALELDRVQFNLEEASVTASLRLVTYGGQSFEIPLIL